MTTDIAPLVPLRTNERPQAQPRELRTQAREFFQGIPAAAGRLATRLETAMTEARARLEPLARRAAIFGLTVAENIRARVETYYQERAVNLNTKAEVVEQMGPRIDTEIARVPDSIESDVRLLQENISRLNERIRNLPTRIQEAQERKNAEIAEANRNKAQTETDWKTKIDEAREVSDGKIQKAQEEKDEREKEAQDLLDRAQARRDEAHERYHGIRDKVQAANRHLITKIALPVLKPLEWIERVREKRYAAPAGQMEKLSQEKTKQAEVLAQAIQKETTEGEKIITALEREMNKALAVYETQAAALEDRKTREVKDLEDEENRCNRWITKYEQLIAEARESAPKRIDALTKQKMEAEEMAGRCRREAQTARERSAQLREWRTKIQAWRTGLTAQAGTGTV